LPIWNGARGREICARPDDDRGGRPALPVVIHEAQAVHE
jgi:hypothetical protein